MEGNDILKKDFSIRAFAVIDTNVFVSALRSPNEDATPAIINTLVDNGIVIPLYDDRILSEYYSVLNYARFGFLPEVIEEQMNIILSKGIYVDDVKKIDACFKDETDIPFYEVMLDTQEIGSQLVTGNVKHYPKGSFVTPQQFLSNLTYLETFVKPLKNIDYQEAVDKKILDLISTDKYFLGDILPKKFVDKLKEKRLNKNEHIFVKDYIK